jgi:predicted RNase H-related nuclease YkuK (DUF458 family)
MKKFNFTQIEKYLDEVGKNSKIYIGCDSTVFKRNGEWFANYYKVIVVHKDGCHGCKIFGEIEIEKDFSNAPLSPSGKRRKPNPSFRLMNEVYKVSELFMTLAKITDKHIDVHLDLNPDKKYASSGVIDQAIGYIKGTCNVIPFVKPDAFAASYAADRLLRVKAI